MNPVDISKNILDLATELHLGVERLTNAITTPPDPKESDIAIVPLNLSFEEMEKILM